MEHIHRVKDMERMGLMPKQSNLFELRQHFGQALTDMDANIVGSSVRLVCAPRLAPFPSVPPQTTPSSGSTFSAPKETTELPCPLPKQPAGKSWSGARLSCVRIPP